MQKCAGDHLMSICVTANDKVDCQQPVNVTRNVTGFSRLVRDTSSKCVTAYFTSGTHFLENTIVFAQNIASIQIIGMVIAQTTIECEAGFGDSLDVTARSGDMRILNIIFEKCSKWRQPQGRRDALRISSALFFQNFNVTIENVVIQNSLCGILAYECAEVVIRNCKFYNNTNGHVQIIAHEADWDSLGASVVIYQSLFYNGSSSEGGGLRVIRTVQGVRDGAIFSMQIIGCIFSCNTAYNGSHFHMIQESSSLLRSFAENIRVLITDCVFTESAAFYPSSSNSFGIFFDQVNIPANTLDITISRSIVNRSESGGIFIRNANAVVVDQCEIINNRRLGMHIIKTFAFYATAEVSPVISQTTFYNNSKALDVGIAFFAFPDRRRKRRQAVTFRKVLIKNCTFTGHRIYDPVVYIYDVLGLYVKLHSNYITIHIENSHFGNNLYAGKKDRTNYFYCSVLYLERVYVEITDSSFTGNSCTAISLNSSVLRIKDKLNLTQNYAEFGGGLRLSYYVPQEKPKIIFEPHAKLYSIQNRATEYGGSIYTEEMCEDHNEYCFFQLELVQTSTATFHFVGNRADKGGDVIFGGCLSNCLIKSGEIINLQERNNIFWKIMSLDAESQSNFADYPNRVVFCENTSIFDSIRPTCKDTHQVTVYRGGIFSVQMMAVGHLCSPSYNIIRAEVPPEVSKGVHIRKGENYKPGNTYCEQYTYSLRGGQSNNSNFTIYVALTLQERKALTSISTQLIVDYINHCPPGFQLDKNDEKCLCSALLESIGVRCMDDYSLDVPALVWVGTWRGKVAVGAYCQHCKSTGVHRIKNTSNSDSLCAQNRTGKLCGECVNGYSMYLGGYKCGDCSKSNYKGILLTIAFALIGFLLVVVLLKLNLTVSTGLINGLILYANIVYSNHSIFLPFDREIGTEQHHLNNAVHFLFVFQAWLNLDFGFDICYFHGTDTFVVTWLQFVFPLYIWVIIFVIVIVSRYSTKVSKLTGHNTISVLATLLLLSYTKLLLAILFALSYTQLHLVDGSKSHPVWASDANVRYVVSKHITLFLMSIFMVSAYIIPFTALIALGPILISRSNYKVLRWIHKIKPFLDAFYGPYTKTYRYWPGILLIMRLILTSTIAFYSSGDSSFVLVTISVSLPLLFLLWLLVGRTQHLSLHRERKYNLLELFFLLNLTLFSIISLYQNLKYPNDFHNQQVLAVVMVGSVFMAFCGILAYITLCKVRSWQMARKFFGFFSGMHKGKKLAEQTMQQDLIDDSIGTYHGNRQPATQTTLEMSQHLKKRGVPELREPLLEESTK